MCLRGRTLQLLATPSLPRITFEFHLASCKKFCSQGGKKKKNTRYYFGPFLNWLHGLAMGIIHCPWPLNVVCNNFFNICNYDKMLSFNVPFHGTNPKWGVVSNDPLFLLSLLFNQRKKYNIEKTYETSQLLHLIIIGKIPIMHNKKYPWDKLSTITHPKFGLFM